MKLSFLISGIQTFLSGPAPEEEIQISSIEYDSRQVTPGALFVAIPGEAVDGHRYIDSAIEKGAVAVVGERQPKTISVPFIQVANARVALADISAAFYGNPAEKLTLIGVTGTNGKTTTTYILESIFKAAGHNCGVMGTVNTRYNGFQSPSTMTTPESRDIQKTLSEMVEAGVTHAVMEVSSHALALQRVQGCRFDAAIFTNLTQDHLDYHGSMESYWEMKKRLFAHHLKEGGKGIINSASEKGRELITKPLCPVFSVGSEASSLTTRNISVGIDCMTGEFVTKEGSVPFSSRSTGRYNLENILCAAGAALSTGISMEAIVEGIRAFKVPGRLEWVENSRKLHLFVDYAHTPDALENVLSTLRSLVPGRLISVFGCGGDRDRTKRPLMGEIGTRLSDLAVITSDNPRTEDPWRILEDVIAGVGPDLIKHDAEKPLPRHLPKGYVVEPDRKKAIAIAVNAALPGDTILIAGKGHETYQVIGDTRIDFDDRVEVARAVENAT
ncbi:MAG: UDP-N-acetylmuramoyl-L-alanyl-D-glutamate--2,6-diaminopimelate ligase [Desulfobacterales bacterium]|nr:UDP-N-acetylmuramoyl-L-alanyl-D-glutamate--2,6-diaminopimelate ligase [Desulfobacterales bacterium]